MARRKARTTRAYLFSVPKLGVIRSINGVTANSVGGARRIVCPEVEPELYLFGKMLDVAIAHWYPSLLSLPDTATIPPCMDAVKEVNLGNPGMFLVCWGCAA